LLKRERIVGAGPAGLTLALLLAKAGIQVRLLEQAAKPTEETRAIFYNVVSQHECKRAGVYDNIVNHGFVTNQVAFRDLTGERLFEMTNRTTTK
jgi:2-polyprenyl-6-methoxyphenol hydroxylase-like FAD-dependent oxidoreductase